MEITWKIKWKLGVCRGITYLWLAGNEGMEKKMETTVLDYIANTIRIHSSRYSGFEIGTWG